LYCHRWYTVPLHEHGVGGPIYEDYIRTVVETLVYFYRRREGSVVIKRRRSNGKTLLDTMSSDDLRRRPRWIV
jgi:hypothetical protein